MTEETEKRSIDREELDSEEAVELPDREAMSIIATGPHPYVPPIGPEPVMDAPQTTV